MTSAALINDRELEYGGLGMAPILVLLTALLLHASVACGEEVTNQCPPKKPGRYALVVGNSSYLKKITGIDPLSGTVNDAKAIADALCANGFEVDVGTNQSKAEFKRAVDRFRARSAENSMRVFYYSGHAIQYNEENFLIPTDAHLRTVRDIESETINLGLIYKALSYNKGNIATNVIILDACRTNPFGDKHKLGNGLALPKDAPAGTLVAFATAPGYRAQQDPSCPAKDQDPKKACSPYTKTLLEFIRLPGFTLPELFDAVRKEFLVNSATSQVPWENSSTLAPAYLADPVRAEWFVDQVDDLVEVYVSGSPVLEKSAPDRSEDHWTPTPATLLKPGSNPFEILVYNDKTYRNHDVKLGIREGWKFSVRLRINGENEMVFAGGEEVPPLKHWGHLFQVHCGDIQIGPNGVVRVVDRECQRPKYIAGPNEWQEHLRWCIENTGPVDCPEEYHSAIGTCSEVGGRQCLISSAVRLAKEGNCFEAFQMALICQCHNQDAQEVLKDAGEKAVCGYLATYQSKP